MTVKQTEIPEASSAIPGAAGMGHVPRSIGHFMAHFAEMCISMCVGGALLNAAFFLGAGLIGSSNLDQRYPELPILVMAAGMAVSMGAWMHFRHHPTRHTVEMSGTTVVVAILMAGAYWTGMLSESSLPGWPQTMAVLCGPECLAMFLVMLFHIDHYTGKMRHPVRAT